MGYGEIGREEEFWEDGRVVVVVVGEWRSTVVTWVSKMFRWFWTV